METGLDVEASPSGRTINELSVALPVDGQFGWFEDNGLRRQNESSSYHLFLVINARPLDSGGSFDQLKDQTSLKQPYRYLNTYYSSCQGCQNCPCAGCSNSMSC